MEGINPQEIERILKLIIDMNLESSTLMWAVVAYFGFGLVKSLMGFAVLGAVGIYWAKTVRYLIERRATHGC